MTEKKKKKKKRWKETPKRNWNPSKSFARFFKKKKEKKFEKTNSPLARQAKAFKGHMPLTRYKSRFQVTLIYDETCLHVPIQNMIISQTYAGSS